VTFSGKSIGTKAHSQYPLLNQNQGLFFDGSTYLQSKNLVIAARFSIDAWVKVMRDGPATLL
jgi:hypothetical protein